MAGVRKQGILEVDNGGGGGGTSVDIVSPIGPDTKANSVSVTLATDEDPIDVNVLASALPAGASTSINQTNGSQKTQVVDSLGNVVPTVLDDNGKRGFQIHSNVKQSDIFTPAGFPKVPLFPIGGLLDDTGGSGNFVWTVVRADGNNPVEDGTDVGLFVRQVGLPVAALPTDATVNPKLTKIQDFNMVWENGSLRWNRMAQPVTNTELRASALSVKVTDGVDTAEVVAGSTIPVYANPALVVANRETVKNGSNSVLADTERGFGVFGSDSTNTWRPIPINSQLFSGIDVPTQSRVLVQAQESAYGNNALVLGALNASADTVNWSEGAAGAMIFIRNTGAFIGTISLYSIHISIGTEIPTVAFDTLGNAVTTLQPDKIYYVPAVRLYLIRVRVTAYTSGSCTAYLAPTVHTIVQFVAANVTNGAGAAAVNVQDGGNTLTTDALVSSDGKSYIPGDYQSLSLTPNGFLRVEANPTLQPWMRNNPWEQSSSPWSN